VSFSVEKLWVAEFTIDPVVVVSEPIIRPAEEVAVTVPVTTFAELASLRSRYTTPTVPFPQRETVSKAFDPDVPVVAFAIQACCVTVLSAVESIPTVLAATTVKVY